MNEIKKISDLAVDHSYYCNLGNYYKNGVGEKYRSWSDFLADWEDSDMDYNLVFRWDVKPHDDEKTELGYYMEVFFILQRKGIYTFSVIDNVFDRDVKSIVEFLSPRYNHLMELWEPLLIPKA